MPPVVQISVPLQQAPSTAVSNTQSVPINIASNIAVDVPVIDITNWTIPQIP